MNNLKSTFFLCYSKLILKSTYRSPIYVVDIGTYTMCITHARTTCKLCILIRYVKIAYILIRYVKIVFVLTR